MANAILDNIENLKILLVDDDPFMQKVIEKILNDLGFGHIQQAKNGEHALEILNTEYFDLLLTDIQMPTLNGLELMQKIRCGQTPAPRNLRTIIITSFSNTETLGSSLALDVNGFLTKPFKPATVMKTLFQALTETDNELRSEGSYMEVNTDLLSLGVDSPIDNTVIDTSANDSDDDQEPSNTGSKTVSLHQLQPNMRLTKDIKTDKGILLLSEGFILNQNTIRRLHELGNVIAEEEYHVEILDQLEIA